MRSVCATVRDGCRRVLLGEQLDEGERDGLCDRELAGGWAVRGVVVVHDDDDIVVIDHGTVIAEGTSDELKTQTGGERIEVTLEDDADADSAIAAMSELCTDRPVFEERVVRATVRQHAGVIAEAVRRLDRLGRTEDGARPGDFSFAVMVARIVFEHRARFEPVLDIEGHGRAAFLLVGNGDPYSYAGPVGLRATPGARFEDGIAFAAPTRIQPLDVPRLFTALVRGSGFGPEVLMGYDLDRLEVRCDHPLPLQVDGEDLGDVESAVFEARRDALSCLV